jgi:hypothetical protein
MDAGYRLGIRWICVKFFTDYEKCKKSFCFVWGFVVFLFCLGVLLFLFGRGRQTVAGIAGV